MVQCSNSFGGVNLIETMVEVAKPSDVFNKYRGQLLGVLHESKQTCLRFLDEAHTKRIIICKSTKDKIEEMQLQGENLRVGQATTLLNIAELMVKVYPKRIFTIIEIMEKLEYLQSIAEDMRKDVQQQQIEEQKEEIGLGNFVI